MTQTPHNKQQMRRWQIEAALAYAEANAWHFLARVTPGGGKTYWALRIAQAELCQGTVERIVLVVPTLPIKEQWVEQFSKHLGLRVVDYNLFEDGGIELGGIGFITTYQQVAGESGSENFRKYCEEFRVFAIFDEVHHASDKNTWGDRLRYAFSGSARILSLTGTPFRSDGRPVPFVRYEENVCQPDYSLVYPQALADNIVRSLRFVFYDGTARWQREGEPPEEGQVSTSGEESPETLRAALDPSGDFARAMIEGAHSELLQMPAGSAGLLVAKDTEHANHLAKLLTEVTGRQPTVVHTASAGSKHRIKNFRDSSEPWIVSVRMVSEGVDIPRVRVVCWMTNYKTQLYFEQLIARGLRGPAHEECVIVLPQLPTLVSMSYAVTHAQIPALTNNLCSGKDEQGGGEGRLPTTVTFLGSEGYLSKIFAPSSSEPLVESETMLELSRTRSHEKYLRTLKSRLANPENARATVAKWREKNKDKVNERAKLAMRSRREESPESSRASCRKSREKRLEKDPEYEKRRYYERKAALHQAVYQRFQQLSKQGMTNSRIVEQLRQDGFKSMGRRFFSESVLGELVLEMEQQSCS